MPRTDVTLDLSFWARFRAGKIYYSDEEDGTLASLDLTDPEVIYRPLSSVPRHALLRVKGSDKRVDGEGKRVVVAEGPWGTLSEVTQLRGPVVGIQLTPTPGHYASARSYPDYCHLMTADLVLPDDTRAALLYEKKGVFLYSFGARDTQDVYLVTKERDFRARFDPKAITFTKEDHA